MPLETTAPRYKEEMAYHLLYTFFVVVVITNHVTIVDSCTCLYTDPRQDICTSSVAINATVVSTSYPEGEPDSPYYGLYPVRYELKIHNVFNSPGGIDDVPNVVDSFLPGSLCGLSLADNTTYILAGYIVNDTYNPENQVIGMMLCNLHIYVSGEWGSYRNEADELIEQLDCSNPPSYVGPEYEIELIPLKRNQQAKAPQSNGKKDALRALGLAVNRREMTSGLETFLSIFSGGVDKRRQNLLP